MQLIGNNARALLAGSISAVDTSLTVEAGKADTFRVATTTNWLTPLDWFKVTLQDVLGNIEIVAVGVRTSGSGVMSVLLRAQDGTTARAFPAGSIVESRITAQDIEAGVNAVQTSIQKTGGTMTGDLVLAGNADNALEAVPLQQLTAVVEAAADVSADALAAAVTAITNAITAARKEAAPPGMKGRFAQTTAPAGWVKSGGGTIGNAASGATARANADTLDLFTVFWNQFSNGALTIQTSAGAPTTRGVDAATDYADNKRMPIPETRGEHDRDLDDGRGVDPGRALGSYQADEIKAHTHSQQNNTVTQGASGLQSGVDFFISLGGTTQSTGGAENRVRTTAWLACFKL